MYFFEAGTFPEKLIFQKKNFEEQVFSKTVTFSEKLVLHNQIYSIILEKTFH